MLIENSTSLTILNHQRRANTGLRAFLEKLSTGKRINRASDDAAMLSVARELEKQVRGFRRVDNNIGDALSALRIADGGASSISNMIQRQRELAIQASNGTLNQDQRNALNTEFQALATEINRVSLSSQFNGQSLLDGKSELSDGTGEITTGTGTNPGDRVALPNSDLTASTLGIDAIDISNPANINNALSSLDSAMRTVNATRTAAGATYNRFEYSQENARTAEINTAAALSQAEDLDFAKGVADKARASLLSQTSTAALSNFHQISKNNVLGLLNSSL